MKLIVISPSYDVENEISQVETMFRKGLEVYHIRKPNYTTKDYENYLERINPKFYDRIVLHSRHNLVKKYRLKGVHVSKNHRKTFLKTFFRILGIKLSTKGKLSISTGISHLSVFEKVKFTGYNYILLTPVFPSISKKGRKGAFSMEKLRRALKKNRPFDVIASGGIDIQRLEKVRKLGFDGAAIMGGIWEQPDPLISFEECLKFCDNLKK